MVFAVFPPLAQIMSDTGSMSKNLKSGSNSFMGLILVSLPNDKNKHSTCNVRDFAANVSQNHKKRMFTENFQLPWSSKTQRTQTVPHGRLDFVLMNHLLI